MSNKDSFLSGLLPFAVATGAVMLFSRSITEQNFPWLGCALSIFAIFLALRYGSRNSGSALLGVAIGVYVTAAMYGSLADSGRSVPVATHPNLFFAFLVVALGFPLGVLVRVSMGESAPRLITAIIFGVIACLYMPFAYAAYGYVGLPESLLDPFNPWFQFGSMLNASAVAAALNVLGVCIAGGIALLILSWPLFLTLGLVAVATSK